MTLEGGREAAALLRERIAREHPDWPAQLQIAEDGREQVLACDVPHRPGHRLSVHLSSIEATVAYSDGLPPGPAEQLLIWRDAPVSDGVEAVLAFLEQLIEGHLALIRVRIPRLTRLLRRDGADSLLRFEPAGRPGGLPRQRRGTVQAWSWIPPDNG